MILNNAQNVFQDQDQLATVDNTIQKMGTNAFHALPILFQMHLIPNVMH